MGEVYTHLRRFDCRKIVGRLFIFRKPIRGRLVRWLAQRLYNTPDGEILPKPLRYLNMLLHPALIFYRNKDWYYDIESDCFHILGVRYSRQYFEDISWVGNVGQRFEIKQRESWNGFTEVTCQHISKDLDPEIHEIVNRRFWDMVS